MKPEKYNLLDRMMLPTYKFKEKIKNGADSKSSELVQMGKLLKKY